jgi:hypothetical protein
MSKADHDQHLVAAAAILPDQEAPTELDDDKYREAMIFLTKTAYDEYKQVCVELPRFQMSLLKTYLWLSSLVLTVEAGVCYKAMTGDIKWGETVCTAGTWFFAFAAAALVVSMTAFVLGVDTLRGRRRFNRNLPLGDFTDLATEAYDMASKPRSTTLYSSMIAALNREINRQAAITSRLGLKLRRMSQLILISVVFAMLAGTVLFWGRETNTQQRPKEVSVMAEEKKTPPPPPPPKQEAKPIQPTGISTHSQKPVSNRVNTSESKAGGGGE